MRGEGESGPDGKNALLFTSPKKFKIFLSTGRDLVYNRCVMGPVPVNGAQIWGREPAILKEPLLYETKTRRHS